MRRAAVLTGLLLTAVLSLPCALAAAAAGSPAPVPWTGIFQVALQGRQVNAWHVHHYPVDHCDGSFDGNGAESDQLLRGTPQAVVVTGIGPTIVSMSGGGPITSPMLFTRNGAYTFTDPSPEETTDCPGASGGGGGDPPPPPDCGTLGGSAHLLVTALGPWLRVQGDPGEGGTSPFTACPNPGTAYPAFLETDLTRSFLTSAAPMPGGFGITSFQLTGEQFKVESGDPELEGTVHTQLTADLTGVAVVAEVLARSTDVEITPAGTARVVLTCPAHVRAGCRGTLGVLLSPSEAPPTRFPAAVPAGAMAFGRSTAFTLRSGRRSTVALRLGRSQAALQGLADLPLDIAVTQRDPRGRRVTSVVAVGHVRPG